MKPSTDNTPDQNTAREPRRYRTRVPEAPGALFNGALVNGKKLRHDYLNGIPEAALARLVKNGMPVIRVPGSQRYLFDPESVLDWYKRQQVSLNQDPSATDRKQSQSAGRTP